MANPTSPKLKSRAKLGLTIFVAVYATTLIGLNLAAKHYLNTSDTKKLLQEKSVQYLNKKLQIEQEVSLKFSWNFSPTLTIKDINIENLMNAKELQVSVSPWPLLFKEIYIKKLLVKDFILTIKSSKSAPKPATTADSASNYNLMFDTIEFFNGKITMIENGESQNIDLKEVTLYNDNMELTSKAELNLMGKPCNIKLVTDINNLNNIKIELKQLQYGNINIYGNLNLKRNPNSITGALFSDKLVFEPKESKSEAKGKSGSNAYQLPDVVIPINYLNMYKIDLSYSIKQLATNMLRLNNIVLAIKQDNNLLNVKINANDSEKQGNISSNLNYNLNPGSPASSALSIDTSISNTKLENIFINLKNENMFDGGDLKLSLKMKSSGNTIKRLVATSHGKILLQSGQATFHKNLNMKNNLVKVILDGVTKSSDSKTSFKCIVVNLNLDNGTAVSNQGIALESSMVGGIQGSGTINFNNGNLDLNLKPQKDTSQKNNKFALLEILKLTGTITSPQAGFSAEGLIDAGIDNAGSLIGGEFGKLIQIVKEVKNDNKDNKSPCQTALEK